MVMMRDLRLALYCSHRGQQKRSQKYPSSQPLSLSALSLGQRMFPGMSYTGLSNPTFIAKSIGPTPAVKTVGKRVLGLPE